MSETDERAQFTNWAGNESCRPRQIAYPRTEEEVSETIASARRLGLPVRVVGAGHSFSTICLTDGVLISLDRMSGIIGSDPGRNRVRVRAGASAGSSLRHQDRSGGDHRPQPDRRPAGSG